MAEKLVVRNFGPIKEADIQVRDLTVFVGPQATGKSITAQLLYFMRGLEDLSGRSFEAYLDRRRRVLQNEDIPDLSTKDTPLQSAISALEWWFGNEVSVYANPDTVLRWNPKAPSAETEYEIRWDEKGPRLNQALEKRIRKGLASQSLSPSQVYIPAGRALYSFLPPASAIRFLSLGRFRVQWPGYIVMFYEALGAAINQLWQNQEIEQIPIMRSEAKFVAATDFVRPRMDAVIKGQIRYSSDTIALRVGQQVLRPETVAAGQMEMWPFWTILQEILRSEYFDLSRVYFEEPEAHLHPGAQRNVMESIAYLVRQGWQLVITTHSPYILYTVNNFLMAQQVLDKGKKLPPGIPREIALRAERVAAYRFSPDGRVHDIMDAEVGLIDEDELDRVADELGTTFSLLQEGLE